MINIFVAKLDFSISSDQLREEFEKFGRVNKATVATDRETGKPRGFAFVEMANREEGEEAIEALDGKTFNGRSIAVKEAEDRRGNKSKPNFNSPQKKFTPNNTTSSSTRFEENKKSASEVDSQINDDEFKVAETRKKIKERGKKEFEKEELKPKKQKNPSLKKQNKYGKFSDFDEDEDDISLLSLRKELEREDFEDDDEDEDDIILEF
ncbi:MAG: hypothetical protein P8I93_09520 [Crocinitomicaceae bacterium]|nr:hypothetical protein [Crocinitomicaceae bacterium]